MPDIPHLLADAQLVPSTAGLLASIAGEIESIPLDISPVRQAQLLDLLEHGCELGEYCAVTGMTAPRMQALIDRLTVLGLVAADAATDSSWRTRTGISCSTLAEPSSYFRDAGSIADPQERPRSVLLAGLGQLGLALLRQLLRFEHFRPRLFDPTVVGRRDISPFYRAEALGLPKSAVLSERLAAAQRERVHAVVPQGLSAAAVERALDAALGEAELVVCCLDQPSDLPTRLTHACHARRIPLVVAQLTARGGLIDPVLVPGKLRDTQGCVHCAALYRAGADPFAAALPSYLAARFPQPAPWRFPHSSRQIEALAELTALALRKAFDIDAGLRPPDDKVTRIDFGDWCVDTSSVPKHYACRLCLPVSSPVPAPMRERLRRAATELDLETLAERLRPLAGAPYGIFEADLAIAARERHALFRTFRRRGVEPLHNRLANAHLATSVRRAVNGADMMNHVGEYLDPESSRNAGAIAMIEGLERLFTLDYCVPERIVQGTYADLGSVALDPRSLPLFSEEQYADPDFPFRRPDPQLSLSWIEGVSLADDRPVLVPLEFVRSTPGATLCQATSNGAACHSSLPQAIVNAIYETVERDALMITWLNQLALPGIELASDDPDPYALRETFHRLGFELSLVDLTTDLEIPVLLGVLRDRHNPDFLLTNMVASLEPQRALGKLCRELAQFAHGYLRDPRCFESDLTRAADPAQISTFRDHLAFYQAREKHRYADFLTRAPRDRRLGGGSHRPAFPDICGELAVLEARLARRGYDVIVVDCSAPLLTQLGLHVVKVVIPGLQPLNAGHRRRVLGGRRLYRVPVDMGLHAREKTFSDLNPWPHPFW